jgi:hypothetical protein
MLSLWKHISLNHILGVGNRGVGEDASKTEGEKYAVKYLRLVPEREIKLCCSC